MTYLLPRRWVAVLSPFVETPTDKVTCDYVPRLLRAVPDKRLSPRHLDLGLPSARLDKADGLSTTKSVRFERSQEVVFKEDGSIADSESTLP